MLSAYLDGTLFGERVGDDPHVLALHGWGRDHRDFDQVLRDIPSIRLDLPGFGASPVPDEAPTSRRVARLLMPLVDELSDPKIILGHSYGGRVALRLAAERDDVAHVVLVGTPVIRRVAPGKASRAFRLIRRAHDLGLVSDERMEAARQKYGSADYRAATGVMREALVSVVGESYDDALEAITCPVTLITGELDTAAPPDVQHEAAGKLARGQAQVVPNVGHLMGPEHGEVIRAALEAALP